VANFAGIGWNGSCIREDVLGLQEPKDAQQQAPRAESR
jgi:hypothetical protein